MIKTQTYKTNDVMLLDQVIIGFIDKFWVDIFENIKDTKHLWILFKVKFTDESLGFRSIGHLVKVNYEDQDQYISFICSSLTQVNSSYTSMPISQITFSYVIKEGLMDSSESEKGFYNYLGDKMLLKHNFNNVTLPITMDPADYGDIRQSSYVTLNGVTVERFTVDAGTRIYEIDVSSNGMSNKVSILGIVNLSWIDTRVQGEGGIELIERQIRKSTIYFNALTGEVVLRKQNLNKKSF